MRGKSVRHTWNGTNMRIHLAKITHNCVGHLRTSVNDERKKSRMYDERTKFHMWEMRKKAAVAVRHRLYSKVLFFMFYFLHFHLNILHKYLDTFSLN